MSNLSFHHCGLVAMALLCWAGLSNADEPRTHPEFPDGTQAALEQIARFHLPAGFDVQVMAAEPQVASPVAICLDERNRIFVAESYRFSHGTPENRRQDFLLEDDLQVRTLDDRLAMYQKWEHRLDGGMAWFTKYADQVRLLEDRDKDGRADRSSVFAPGFNGVLDGLAAGVIARDGDLWFTCIPNLYRLRDDDGDGVADVKETLLSGFGVRASYLGHDLHGLTWGPDGRLYFSVGDRGFHVTRPDGRVLAMPNAGAVFRCDADGSNFEVVAVGLRNPQELAFDRFGNLFAADNNCDKGDYARLVYVVEGGDSGWRMNYQTLLPPYLVGPWHAERIWYLRDPLQPDHIVPPVGRLGAGPCGFAYYPGTGLPVTYDDHFFMCNYSANGGIETFSVRPQGAGFVTTDERDFLKPINATDIDFGYDGKVYVSDFVDLGRDPDDFTKDGFSVGGRIYTLQHAAARQTAAARNVERLFAEGFRGRSTRQLVTLLGHRDLRVRQRAQFTLAGRDSADTFMSLLRNSAAQEVRLHSVWGLWQLSRRESALAQRLIPMLDDDDPEIRAQVARVLGDVQCRAAAAALIERLDDQSDRVRFFAMLALGRLQHPSAVQPLIAQLREHGDRDRFLRHAAVTALGWIGQVQAVVPMAESTSSAVRRAALLVLRQWLSDSSAAALTARDPEAIRNASKQVPNSLLERFLHDDELAIVTSAARVINDLPVIDAEPALAALGPWWTTSRTGKTIPDALARRIINANFRQGTATNAANVSQLVVASVLSDTVHDEAVDALRQWSEPPARDRVTGSWRPLSSRPPKVIQSALRLQLPQLLLQAPVTSRSVLIGLLEELDIEVDQQLLESWLLDESTDSATRTASLKFLVSRSPRSESFLRQAIGSRNAQLRAEARDLWMGRRPEMALPLLLAAWQDDSAATVERQRAIKSLAEVASPQIDAELRQWVLRLAEGRVPNELQLDILLAARTRDAESVRQALGRYEQTRSDDDKLSHHRVALYGGDAVRGRLLFTGHLRAQCFRCHKVRGTGGDSGPDLTDVASRHSKNTREYLLESLIEPNAQLAPGFGSQTLLLASGVVQVGTVLSEQDELVKLKTPQGELLTFKSTEIEFRSASTSPMPTVRNTLTLGELRDLVEYLATLK